MLKEKLREIAPPELGIKNDLYGLQFGSELKDRNLKKIIICIDPTKQVILEAVKRKAHLIISHHGFMENRNEYLNDEVLDQIKLLSMNDIDLFVIKSAWDAASGGISESLTKLLGLNIEQPLHILDYGVLKPIGRIGSPILGTLTFYSFLKNIKRHLNVPTLQYWGNLEDSVNMVGIIGGIGLNEPMIKKFRKLGCDTAVTGDISYLGWLLARKLNLKIVSTTHYVSEELGMKNLARILSLVFPRDEIIYLASHDPISYLLEDKNS